MRRFALLLVFPALLALSVCAQSEPPRRPALAFVEHTTGGARATDALPLVVAVHGLGDRPEDFIALFRELDVPARVVAPRAPDAFHGGFSWYPFDRPEAKLAVIRERAALLADLIRSLSATRPTRGKAVITGFSQGGVMSFALAAYHPALLAAALPISGAFDPAMPDPVGIQSPLPVIAFHGREDARIPFGEAEAAVARFKRAGRAAELRAYDGVGHHIPPPVQRDLFAALRTALASR